MKIHATTILTVEKDGLIAMGGDGQVTLGSAVMKSDAMKIRKLLDGKVLVGFAGSSADAFALMERFEGYLKDSPKNITRAATELAKQWRMDKALRQLEALLITTDGKTILLVSGTGDVIQPTDGIAGIGSGGNFAIEKLTSKNQSNTMTEKNTPLKPSETVEKLDRYIVGQADAKRAVAVAMRNRWRRQQLPDEMRNEVSPKNILMIGSTGVGKTEIARRLAKLRQRHHDRANSRAGATQARSR